MSDLLQDDVPGGPNSLPSGSNNSIIPSRFFLPSGERVEAHPSQRVQDSEAFLIANTVQKGRGEYYGSTSDYRLVEFALEFHDGVKCEPMAFEDRFPNRRREFWEAQDVSFLLASCNLRQYADQSQWMGPHPCPPSNRLEFPPPDVIASLVDAYFAHSNIYYPVLHRPTFQRLLDQELHQHDHELGSLLLVVCAIGTRFSDHPYVSDVTAEGTNRCMTQWLIQTREVMKKSFTSTATLFEVQYYCVSRSFARMLEPGARVESPSFAAPCDMP